ncbi:MAG: hypothetical protein QOJ53_697 [Sphingomonadales bacterium]|nr:hypothetical protein [Sphingomonadales bacterium]MEA3045631.1 hypothetical protein [Sphingomonadales bacterium]MEA3046365.1 hypothetical protein [Sphingomonadales bacterium]
MIESFEPWVPALSAAAAGASLFAYAWLATRRFDRSKEAAQATLVEGARPAVRIERTKTIKQKSAASGSVSASARRGATVKAT